MARRGIGQAGEAEEQQREQRVPSPRYPEDYVGLEPGYVKPASLAWYASHRHTADGLNAQVYNRCIGTRYCANACPFNTRYFDFFNPQWPKPLHLQLNPDVSVREVGVMEKCTFCVQRIKAAQIDAKAAKRDLKDGEVQPACVQGCSARALVFGDLNDPESEVARLARAARGSKLLEDLGTLPNVTYLERQTAV